MSPDDDDATQPVEAVAPDDEPPALDAQREIEDLRDGYERNRRRSRMGVGLGVAALVALIISTPIAVTLIDVLAELREQNDRQACRAELAAANDNAQIEFFAAIISRPFDQARVDRSVATLNRVAALRGSPTPCAAAAKVGDVIAGTPRMDGGEATTTTSTTTTTAPGPGPPGTSGQQTTTTTTSAPAGPSAQGAPESTEPAPPDTRPGRRICLPVVGCVRISSAEQHGPGARPEPAKGVPSRRPATR